LNFTVTCPLPADECGRVFDVEIPDAQLSPESIDGELIICPQCKEEWEWEYDIEAKTVTLFTGDADEEDEDEQEDYDDQEDEEEEDEEPAE
jgi:hypothetical protein